jgi:hypothetical protein
MRGFIRNSNVQSALVFTRSLSNFHVVISSARNVIEKYRQVRKHQISRLSVVYAKLLTVIEISKPLMS